MRARERAHREAAEKVIDFLDLQAHRDSFVVNLPYGVRKVVEMGRALCTEPSLLLLDEPSSGLSVEETADMAFWIQDIRTLLADGAPSRADRRDRSEQPGAHGRRAGTVCGPAVRPLNSAVEAALNAL